MRDRVNDCSLHQRIGNHMEGPTPIPFWGITTRNHRHMRFDTTVDRDWSPTAWGLVEEIENVCILLLPVLIPDVVYGSS
jgi:hypothetical protein